MKLERSALVVEMVAGIAVVISLVFVAFQLSQNTLQSELETTALQNATYQDLVTNVIGFNTLLIEDAEFAEIVNRAEVDPASLSDVEVRRLNSFSVNVFRHGDMAYFLYTQGTIDLERLNSLLSIVVSRIDSSPLVARLWGEFGEAGILSEAYVAHVEDLRERSDYSAPLNRVLRQN